MKRDLNKEGLVIAARNSGLRVVQEYIMGGETAEARAIVWC